MAETDMCWYKAVCTNKCTGNCVRFLEMRSLMEKSNVPAGRWSPVSLSPDDCDYNAFCDLADIKDDIENFVNEGSNLYLYSTKTGNGKTTWAIKILLKYFDSIWPGNGFRCRGVFIHVPTFLTQLKNFNNINEQFEMLKKRLLEVDIVVWDDVASTNLSSYDHAQLLTYIDQRVLNNKSNLYTGNLREQELIKALGTRLASRVWNRSTRIELKGRDKR